MNVLSSKTPVRLAPMQPPQGGFALAGQMDQEIRSGSLDSLELRYVNDSYEMEKARTLADFGMKSAVYGTMGLLGGFALTEGLPLGAAVGVGLGAYLAWNSSLRHSTGKVTVKHDGQVRQARYFGSAKNYRKTPEEVRAELILKQVLGEQIGPYTPRPGEVPEPESLGALNDRREQLNALNKERRLVADFGQKSHYGYQVLNLVDDLTAAKLIKGGKDVYAVSGSSADVKHTLEVSGTNERGSQRLEQSGTYIDRTYDYTLTPLKSEESLDHIPDGEGLPEGMVGVYKNFDSCSVSIATDSQTGYGMVDGEQSANTHEFRRFSRDRSLDLGSRNKAQVVTKSSINVRDLVTLSGVLGGMLTGMHLAPAVKAAGLMGGVIGGVAGRELGWIAQDHMPRF